MTSEALNSMLRDEYLNPWWYISQKLEAEDTLLLLHYGNRDKPIRH